MEMGLPEFTLLGTTDAEGGNFSAAFAYADYDAAGRHLVVSAHGTTGKAKIDGEFIDGYQLSGYLSSSIPNIKKYQYIRLVICHSADTRIPTGRVVALGDKLSKALDMPVQGFQGKVTVSFKPGTFDHEMAFNFSSNPLNLNRVNNLFENNREYYSRLLIEKNPLADFTIHERNPFNPVTESVEYKNFRYSPVWFGID